ncbi:recombinase family protein [Ensifer sp. NBAIM29]|nr:recombinase family protein [Ensifer sp. NBAIM29]
MLVGYARTSTAEQAAGLQAQVRDLTEIVGCQKTFSEQVSSVGQRAQLSAALDFVREGDTLVVTKLDRLARSTSHLLSLVEQLDQKGVGLRILDFGGGEVDTKSPSGRMLLTVFAAMAQFEREVMLQRQREGILAAKAAGKYKGRKPTARAKEQDIRALKLAGKGASEIARQLGIGRASVYRVLAETE